MSRDWIEFQIKVQPLPEPNDHEVCLLGDGESLIDRFARDMIGLDPGDVLVEPCSLRADETPHTAIICRCDCGEICCGSVKVEIRRDSGTVIWRALPPDELLKIQFNARQYDAEIDRALSDFSWESPDRTIVRLLGNELDKATLERVGIVFSWASGKYRPGMMTVCVVLHPGPYQVLSSIPWDGKSVESTVFELKSLLSRPPSHWPDVEWYPLVQGLGQLSLSRRE